MAELSKLSVDLSTLCKDVGWQKDRAVLELLRRMDITRKDAEAFIAFIICAKLGTCCGEPVSHLTNDQLVRLTAQGTNWVLLR